MRMQVSRKRQQGLALLALLAVLLMGASWFLVSRLNAESAMVVASKREHNAEVLNRAKKALIGYVAAQSAKSFEDNPGALPCPEGTSSFDSATSEGQAASSCTLPKIGRLPWRTLGLEQLRDADGEALWYVVSTGWARTSTVSPNNYTSINSNSVGQLTVDGTANAAVALIIAPGAPVNVTAAGCTSISQVRPLTGTGAGDYRNYLECENATSPADASFVTTGPSGSFNDQVVRITAAEILPAIEAAVADRTAREIAPLLKGVYANVSAWGLASGTPAFPFAAPFANPSSSTYQGVTTQSQGLLPMFREAACAAGSLGCPPVSATAIAWGSASAAKTAGTVTLTSASCSLSPSSNPTSLSCTLTTPNSTGTLSIRAQATINPFIGIRTINGAAVSTAATTAGTGATGFSSGCSGAWTLSSTGATLQCTGSITVGALACGIFWFLCPTKTFNITVPLPAKSTFITDHALTDPADAATGWFVRNRWYELMYYAASPSHLAGGSLACTGSACLSVANLVPAVQGRSLLVLAGRILPAQTAAGGTRPSGTVSHYLDTATNYDGNTSFTKPAVITASANDRFIIVDKN